MCDNDTADTWEIVYDEAGEPVTLVYGHQRYVVVSPQHLVRLCQYLRQAQDRSASRNVARALLILEQMWSPPDQL